MSTPTSTNPGFRFTFLHGVRVRSGTNYLGKLMSCNPHLQSVPPQKTTEEFPLLRVMDGWEKVFLDFQRRYTGPRSDYAFEGFLPHFGKAWLSYLIDNFSLSPGDVFLKDPSVRHLDRFFEVFPDAKLIILVRDGRDNVASSMKAGLAMRKHMTLIQKSKRRLNHLAQRDFLGAARDWSRSVDQILRFDEKSRNSKFSSQYLILRYEDIFREPRRYAAEMFEFMQVPFDDAILDRIQNAEVVGSSFYSAAGQENARKPNWSPTPKTAAFRPVGRWKNWSSLQKRIFKKIGGRQLVSLGYEPDLSWH